jgi:hypothetical protein
MTCPHGYAGICLAWRAGRRQFDPKAGTQAKGAIYADAAPLRLNECFDNRQSDAAAARHVQAGYALSAIHLLPDALLLFLVDTWAVVLDFYPHQSPCASARAPTWPCAKRHWPVGGIPESILHEVADHLRQSYGVGPHEQACRQLASDALAVGLVTEAFDDAAQHWHKVERLGLQDHFTALQPAEIGEILYEAL